MNKPPAPTPVPITQIATLPSAHVCVSRRHFRIHIKGVKGVVKAVIKLTGVPTGIDIRLVVETGLAPTINTGIAHREPGVGQVGAGIVRAPLKCFQDALVAFAGTMGIE